MGVGETGVGEMALTPKMALLLPLPFLFSCLPRGFWILIRDLLITKALKEEAWVLK